MQNFNNNVLRKETYVWVVQWNEMSATNATATGRTRPGVMALCEDGVNVRVGVPTGSDIRWISLQVGRYFVLVI